jgi:tetratricopeptide (TPR) repeat protein
MGLAALNAIGLSQLETGDNPAAVDTFTQVLREAQEPGLRQGQGVALTNLGQAHIWMADYETAAAYIKQALALYRELAAHAKRPSRSGCWASSSGIPVTQRGYASEALAIARDIAARPQEARALGIIGLSHLAAGETREASAPLRQALELYEQIGVPVPDGIRQALRDPQDPRDLGT